jgi:hypothetical protein
MKREVIDKRNMLIVTGAVIGATAGALTSLGSYVRREIRRRGYPGWETCRCDFKEQQTIFQVWYAQHEQRGETIVAEEWGLLLHNPPQWLRRALHHSSQMLATLNPRGTYVERVILSPQEARQLATLLHALSPEDETIDIQAHIVWRREILHAPRHFFDMCLRRLYPAHISPERVATAQPLPALWDPRTNLPLPTEGTLLDTPIGTRIDCIGWASTQVSYCTARLEPEEDKD